MDHLFVDLSPTDDPIFLLDHAGNKDRQVLWGDYLRLDPARPAKDGWTFILWGSQDRPLKIRTADTTPTRPLEIIFVDVGQGDGCVLITPERDGSERIMVIDAGKSYHMSEFLEQRFKIKDNNEKLKFHAAVITHPDEDHYGGFDDIFRNTKAKFKHLYHSGLVERPVPGEFQKLGGKTKKQGDAVFYLRDLAIDDAQTRAQFQGPAGSFVYPKMMEAALAAKAVDSFAMLSTKHGEAKQGKRWVPGFAPGPNQAYCIEILGPLVETDAGGDKLRVLGGYGVTKNGHSVLLRLRHGQFSVLFGGDLNTPAEKLLLRSYTGIDKWPTTIPEREAFIAEARKTFQSDVMKVCHHGAADVTDEFLSAVKPAAFVISSGDRESHVHPRPDLLGRLGRLGSGFAPVLLSTELQRSTREREDVNAAASIMALVDQHAAQPTPKRRDEIAKKVDELARPNVEVDGAIYLKTDGTRLITAFRNEANSQKEKWFYFRYELKNGILNPVSIGG